MIYIDKMKVEFGNFPNKERYLELNKICVTNGSTITLKYETDQDLFDLYILKKYIDNIWNPAGSYFNLHILYMPYSRMDRENNFYSFNLKYVAEFINTMNFNRVIIYDAHSEVTPALINRYIAKTNIFKLFSVFQNDHLSMLNTKVFFPDAGAQKRYEKTICYPALVGMKSRDFATGNITGYKFFGNLQAGDDVVIIDDLCSKGGTFIAAAKGLKEAGAKNIYLITGHCENTVMQGEIISGELIKKMYTTNSILDIDSAVLSGTNIYVMDII